MKYFAIAFLAGGASMHAYRMVAHRWHWEDTAPKEAVAALNFLSCVAIMLWLASLP